MSINPNPNPENFTWYELPLDFRSRFYDYMLVLDALDGEAQAAFSRLLVDAEIDGEAKAKAQAPPPETQPQPPSPRKPRKPGLVTLIRQAEKAGRLVTSITTPDGATFRFGEPAQADNNSADRNEWDDVLK
jgi:hypothetical protein